MNFQVLEAINTDPAIVVVQQTEIELETAENQGDNVVRKAEVDRMQSFVGKKEKSALVMACNRPLYRRNMS